jgi:hypothetical protein
MKFKLVRVDVLDIESEAGWAEFDAKEHHENQKTVPMAGYLVHRDDKWIVLSFCPNSGPSGVDWLGRISIPASIVKRVSVKEVTEV